jgi:hypothetical protein
MLHEPRPDWETPEWETSEQSLREQGCVSIFCQLAGMNAFLIRPRPQNDSADVVVFSNDKRFLVQVTEISLRDKTVRTAFEKDATPQERKLRDVVNLAIHRKRQRHYANAGELNLLVTMSSDGLPFDPAEALNLSRIRKRHTQSPFGSIALLVDGREAHFLKNRRFHAIRH